MHFVIDTVSEFTYFQNMLLGLADTLHKCIGIKRTYIKKLPPLTNCEIEMWETTQRVQLPEDLRMFYSSANGYSFEWTYTFGEEKIVGKVEVNSLEDVNRIYGYETTNDPGVSIDNGRYVLRLAPASKIFELCLLPDRGKVVLVYLYPEYIPTIWLLATTMTLYYLADDIATYLRMAIAHLGIPNWQMAYTPQGIPQWTENIIRTVAPHLLPLNLSLEKMKRTRRKYKDKHFPDVVVNKLDSNIFTQLPRPEANPKSEVQLLAPKVPNHTKKISPALQTKQEDIYKCRAAKKFKRKPLYYVKKR